MATAPRQPFRPLKTTSGMSIPEEGFPEKASQTFKAGAPVVIDATGFLVECPANPPLIMGIASRDGQNGTANGDKTQAVYLAHPSTLFIGNIDNMSSEGTGAFVAADRGSMYGITKTVSATNTPWCVDKNKITAATRRVVVWNLYDQVIDGVAPAVNDTIALVIFSFDPAYFQGNRTS